MALGGMMSCLIVLSRAISSAVFDWTLWQKRMRRRREEDEEERMVRSGRGEEEKKKKEGERE